MRGETRSMCEYPRTHPRHVPYCSSLAGMPNELYVLTSHSCAFFVAGEPCRRGPIESNSTFEKCLTWELSMPIAQMRLMIGSSVGNESAGGSGYFGVAGAPPN